MKTNWMKTLSEQYKRACDEFPDQQQMILFDIDGSILDMRYMILMVLQAFDHKRGTNYFEELRLSQITVHENQVDALVEKLNIPEDARKDILNWYKKQRWTKTAIREMHHPFQGVLDVIRWFQLQPNTDVGLVTGRPETLREDTLHSLNQFGKPYRVVFKNELLFMNRGNFDEKVPDVKVAGLKHFNEAGYHVFAFVDNEPLNLKALDRADLNEQVLLLHANTIFESIRTRVPRGTVRGKEYSLSKLVPSEKVLPSHVQLVWHGVNDEANLRQFLASDVHWVEVDVQLDPGNYNVILRHDSFSETPLSPDEEWITLSEVMKKIKSAGRAIKLDLKSKDILLDQVLELIVKFDLADEELWFNSDLEKLKEQGFRRLAKTHPNAIIQCSIDFLAPLILTTADKAHETLQMLTNWGINRFSLKWTHEELRTIFDQMDKWEYEVNIYNVPDLESFLQAVYMLPCSVTSDFNFPQWHFYGRGPGKGGNHINYATRKVV
ncbi:MAG: DUF2181 domain-containing protein [Anaerolineae bacterium]|nr:DUF2181 domain-containing protein [Anaerolineae bacterium]